MLRTASIRSTYLVPAPLNRPPARYGRSRVIVCHSRPWSRPSAFPDPIQLRAYAEERNHHQHSKSDDPGKTQRRSAPSYIPETIRNELSSPKQVKALEEDRTEARKSAVAESKRMTEEVSKQYKRSVTALIDSISETITDSPDSTTSPALTLLLEARKVMIFTGRNTALGKPTIDGPVATALLAHSLYQCHKVAVIVTDSVNRELIISLLEKINPEAAKYLECIAIDAINGTLVQALSKQISRQKPDATVYIDLPSGNGDGVYLDEENNSIGHFNVAFDQALRMQCLLAQADAHKKRSR